MVSVARSEGCAVICLEQSAYLISVWQKMAQATTTCCQMQTPAGGTYAYEPFPDGMLPFTGPALLQNDAAAPHHPSVQLSFQKDPNKL